MTNYMAKVDTLWHGSTKLYRIALTCDCDVRRDIIFSAKSRDLIETLQTVMRIVCREGRPQIYTIGSTVYATAASRKPIDCTEAAKRIAEVKRLANVAVRGNVVGDDIVAQMEREWERQQAIEAARWRITRANWN